MTDHPIPEPSAEDMREDLVTWYKNLEDKSKYPTGALIKEFWILTMIRRAYHAERKLAEVERSQAKGQVLLGSFNAEGELVFAVWDGARQYMVPVLGGDLKDVRCVPIEEA